MVLSPCSSALLNTFIVSARTARPCLCRFHQEACFLIAWLPSQCWPLVEKCLCNPNHANHDRCTLPEGDDGREFLCPNGHQGMHELQYHTSWVLLYSQKCMPLRGKHQLIINHHNRPRIENYSNVFSQFVPFLSILWVMESKTFTSIYLFIWYFFIFGLLRQVRVALTGLVVAI